MANSHFFHGPYIKQYNFSMNLTRQIGPKMYSKITNKIDLICEDFVHEPTNYIIGNCF